MNNAPIKQLGPAAPETIAPELSTPHFDEIAIAVAQPVEPITPKRDWFAVLGKPRMMIVILLVAALFGTTALALTLQLRRESPVEAAKEIRAEESPAQSESLLGGMFEVERPSSRRIKPRRIRPRELSAPTQPVARRVGVIYGSNDRP